MAIETGTEPKVGELSVQARLEQLEGAIAEAHGHVDKMALQPTVTPNEMSGGLDSSLTRCTVQLGELNDRLSRLAAKVGSL